MGIDQTDIEKKKNITTTTATAVYCGNTNTAINILCVV
jgi:hypothetical protein